MSRQECAYRYSCTLLACILVSFARSIESLNPYWGSRRSAPSIQMTPSCYAFTKSRRHTLLAASTSSSDPHPPDNPPDEIFFASPLPKISEMNDLRLFVSLPKPHRSYPPGAHPTVATPRRARALRPSRPSLVESSSENLTLTVSAHSLHPSVLAHPLRTASRPTGGGST